MAKYISNFAQHMICRDSVLVQRTRDGQIITEPEAPEPIRFMDGQYETNNEEFIKFLDGHRHNGSHFHRVPEEVIKADPDAEYTEVQEVESVNGAVDYLVDTFNADPEKLKSKKAILAVARDNGVLFPNLT